MTGRDYLIAYLATLLALLAVLLGAMLIVALNQDMIGKVEAFGIGTVTGGLIGVLRLPSMRPGGVSDTTAQTLADKIPPATGDQVQPEGDAR